MSEGVSVEKRRGDPVRPSPLDEALEPRYVYPPRGPPQEQLPPLPTLPTPEPLQLAALGVEGAAERLVRSWAKPEPLSLQP